MTKHTPWRIALYLGFGFVAWLWLSQIQQDGATSEGEVRDMRAAAASLKMGDSLRATRTRARDLAAATAARGRALLGKEPPPKPDYTFAKSVSDSMRQLERAFIGMRVHAQRMQQAALYLNEARLIDSTRADMAEGQLAIMTSHTVALMHRLEARRSFTVMFVRLPRPTKWQACLLGGTVGAIVGRDIETASGGCAASILLLPTR